MNPSPNIYYAPVVVSVKTHSDDTDPPVMIRSFNIIDINSPSALFIDASHFDIDHIKSDLLRQIDNRPHAMEEKERARIRESLEGMAPYIEKQGRQKLIETGEQSMRNLAYMPPEMAESWPFTRTYELLRDGVQGNSMQSIAKAKAAIDSSIRELPFLWNKMLEHLGTRIVIYPNVEQNMRGHIACAIRGSNTIVIDEKLCGKDKAGRRRVIMEEAIHVYDGELHFSESEPFQSASRALAEDEPRISKIAHAYAHLTNQKYTDKLKQYISAPVELLPLYHVMEDHLTQLNQKRGCIGFIRIDPERARQQTEAALQDMFGKDIQDLCKEFDRKAMEECRMEPLGVASGKGSRSH